MKSIIQNFEKMPLLVAELHARFASLLSPWERPGEEACMSAQMEQDIKANLNHYHGTSRHF
jgi:hypothetical protein